MIVRPPGARIDLCHNRRDAAMAMVGANAPGAASITAPRRRRDRRPGETRTNGAPRLLSENTTR